MILLFALNRTEMSFSTRNGNEITRDEFESSGYNTDDLKTAPCFKSLSLSRSNVNKWLRLLDYEKPSKKHETRGVVANKGATDRAIWR